jgi:hypothetical protein
MIESENILSIGASFRKHTVMGTVEFLQTENNIDQIDEDLVGATRTWKESMYSVISSCYADHMADACRCYLKDSLISYRGARPGVAADAS